MSPSWHGNPLYCGRIYAVYHAGLVIPVIGAARAALDEYEHIITTKMTYFPPQVPGTPTPTTSGRTATPWPSPTRPKGSS